MNKQKLFEELLKKKGIHLPGGAVLVRRDDPGPYQLSYAQRRIWFLQQFDPGSAAYNDPTALRIKGPLNIPVLEQTFNEIIHRHQVLCMTFPTRNGQPVQVLHHDHTISISIEPLHQWSGYQPGKSMEDNISGFVNWFSGQPFDLSGDMLIRPTLLKIGDDDYILAVNIHHIVMDGWSKGILLQELIDLYEAFSQGKPSPLQELPVQYTDYVHWHHEWLQGKLFASQLAYWKEKLAGVPPVLELPADYSRPNLPTGKGSLEPFSFSRRKFQALKALAKQEDVTLFMVLMAAYNTLLYRYTGQEDILIGTPVANRNRLELENLIGLFVNTLVVRTDLSAEPSFQAVLGRVRAAALETYAHQDIPFEKLVEELNPRRNLSITPLFQVMFQLQNAPMPPAHISGLIITPIQVDTGFSQVDLSLTMWEEQGIIKGTFEYNTDLFAPPTIKRMIGHFKVLLDGIIDDVLQKISHLSMLTEAENHQLLVEWNDTTCDYPKKSCIYELFETCAKKNSLRESVIFNDQCVTYGRLNQQANQLAHELRRLGGGTEKLVAICMENSLELVVGIIGILKAGGAYIPMDTAYPDERLISILTDARPRVFITHSKHVNRFKSYNGKIICLDEENNISTKENSESPGNTGICPRNCKPGSAVCVIYTSGTTGDPRGILIDNRNIVNLVYSFMQSYNPGPGDRLLPLTSIASASFVGEILPILTSGGSIVLADKIHFLDMKKLMRLLAGFDITILSTVPSMIARMNAGEWQPGKLRLLLSGGEALSAGDIDHLIEKVIIVNGYGLTEATICSTYIIVNEHPSDFSRNPVISVGKPVINTQVYILDRHQGIVPIGIPGEIYIAGDGIARGYLNNPELTAERFCLRRPGGTLFEKTAPPGPPRKNFLLEGTDKDHMQSCSHAAMHLSPYHSPQYPIPLFPHHPIYHTGDLGSWLADGTIKFLGRIDTQVQVHGYRIELSEIETHLGLHPDIRDAAVVYREIEPGDRRLVVYFVTAGENGQKRISPGGNLLRDWLSRRIPAYMIPGIFTEVEAIPLNANGKLDTGALPIPSRERPEMKMEYRAPETTTEKTIAAVWLEFLRLEKVGINDNFFDLGGHSLLLTRVHSRLSEIYQNKKELTIVDLFRYPTIHSLAGYIDEGEKSHQSEEIYQGIRDRATKQRQAFSRSKFVRRRSL